MKAGIVGFDGVGKRTLFALLTQVTGAATSRVEQMGMLRIPDERLEELTRLHESRKTTAATIEFVLLPSLVKGRADKLDVSSLRNVDVLVHVVRAFEEPSVPHPEGSVDAARDLELMELELTLSDLAVVEKRYEKMKADTKKGRPTDAHELKALEQATKALSDGRPLRAALSAEDRDRLRGYALLTAKPLLAVVNVGEDEASGSALTKKLGLTDWAGAPGFALTYVSARIESEIAELGPEDAKTFRDDLGLSNGMAERVVRAAFDLLDVITFYTASDIESRAWIIPRDTKAAKAAGTIHSDMERGYIRAEVVHYDVLVREGSWNVCRDKGLLRLEGKEYPIAEADVVYFRFNV
ncbi:MAG: redox-regulated ATPase YchF [Acidobacteria bacterium]|nr:MAG: redox-regulated ATPase YchF [Acidobacteriota bacterium]